MRSTSGKGRGGFSLAELLTILSVLALLIAIAIPNFREAKVASQVAQAKMDLQSSKTGLELYKTDQGAYSLMNYGYLSLLPPSKVGQPQWDLTLERLTTPVAYLSESTSFWDAFE